MSFSDDDLKRVKVHLEIDKEFHENATWVEHVHMDALLARLEAAELTKALFHQWAHTPESNGMKDSIREAALRADDQWRKAAGK